MKTRNGITLIALIITIIVMLILVGVTVTTAINGGLFKSARNAAKGTILEKEKEELTAATVYAYNETTGKIDKTKLENELKGWKIEDSTISLFKCISPNNNVFTIEENGEVSVQEPLDISYKVIEGEKRQYMLTLINNENLRKKILKPVYEEYNCNDIKELMRKVLNGETPTDDEELLKIINKACFLRKESDINAGKIILTDWNDIEKAWAFEIAFYREEQKISVTINNSIPEYESGEGLRFPLIPLTPGKNNIKITMDGQTWKTTIGKETVAPVIKEGDIIVRNNRNYIVLYNDEEHGLQLITEKCHFEFSPKTYSGDGISFAMESDKYIYNNFIEALNLMLYDTYWESEDIEYSRTVGGPFTYNIGRGNNKDNMQPSDTYYLEDCLQMDKLKITMPKQAEGDSRLSYWLGSRIIINSEDKTSYGIRFVSPEGSYGDNIYLEMYNTDNTANGKDYNKYIREVIKISPNYYEKIISNGDGTYTLELE